MPSDVGWGHITERKRLSRSPFKDEQCYQNNLNCVCWQVDYLRIWSVRIRRQNIPLSPHETFCPRIWICLRYGQNLHNICLGYARDMRKLCPRYGDSNWQSGTKYRRGGCISWDIMSPRRCEMRWDILSPYLINTPTNNKIIHESM